MAYGTNYGMVLMHVTLWLGTTCHTMVWYQCMPHYGLYHTWYGTNVRMSHYGLVPIHVTLMIPMHVTL